MRDVPGVAQDVENSGSTGSLRRFLLTQAVGSRAIWSVRSSSVREDIETGKEYLLVRVDGEERME